MGGVRRLFHLFRREFNMRTRTLILGFSLVLSVILADQLSKWVILMRVMRPPSDP